MRMNLIASLAAPIGMDGDPLRFQQRLREVPLARSRQIGNFSLRDLMIATGDLPATAAAGDTPPNEQLIEAAFRDTDGDELKNAGEAAAEAVTLSKDLDQWVTNKVGSSNAANLSPWHELIGNLNKRLSARVETRFPGEAVGSDDSDDTGFEPAGSSDERSAPARTAAGLSGGVHSRDDVLKALNKVLEYYGVYEPSSPVPMLIRRAQRLVTMDFVDIIRDLSPSAIDQLRIIGGDEAVAGSAGPVSTAPPPPPSPASSGPAASAPAPAPKAASDEPVRLSASDFAPRS
jgi:type VI secretion system protein ImpA